MDSNQILARLTEVVADVLDRPDLTLDRSMAAEDVEGWDSLAHVRIVVAAEEAFGVQFRTSEIGGLKNVGDLVDLIARRMDG